MPSIQAHCGWRAHEQVVWQCPYSALDWATAFVFPGSDWPQLDSIHQTFTSTLQHVIDKLQAALYPYFVDLKSAYGWVQGPLLWLML